METGNPEVVRAVDVEESRETEPVAGGRALTRRSFGIGLAGVAVLCAVTPYNDYHLHQTYLYGNHLPLGCLFLFVILTLVVNSAFRRWRKAWALRQPEMLVIWAMLITGSGLASSGLMRYLGPIPIAPFYYGSETNHWTDWTRHIPGWMVPSRDGNSGVIKWFFEGLPDGQSIPWQPWVHVFFAWGILFALVVGLSLCLCMLARKQWVDKERLTFPLVQIPLEMTREPEFGILNSFFRNRLMWLACGLAVLIHGLNGLHSYFFAIPSIPLQSEFSAALPDPPWNGLGIGGLEVFLSVVGVMFLLPTEVSFSLWGFFALFRLVRVARLAMGLEALGGMVPNHEVAVSTGGFVVWGIWMLWAARGHLASMWRKQVPGLHEDVEPIPIRAALIGSVLCFAGIVLWTTAAGVAPLFAVLLWGFFALILVVLTRIVAESGLLFVQTPFMPTDVIAAVPGSQVFGGSGLGPAMMAQTVFAHDPREALMPSVMNSLKLKGNRTGREFVTAILAAIAVGYAVSFVSFLATSYRYGGVNLDSWANTRAPQWLYGQVGNYLDSPKGLNVRALANILLGGGITALLLLMRSSIVGWSLHPIGFLMAGTYAIQRIWFSIFIAWLLKWLVLRFGGLRLFRTVLPFFLGMVLGEAVIGGIWVIVGMITGVGTPVFLPN